MKSNVKSQSNQVSVSANKPKQRARAAYGAGLVYAVDLAKRVFHVNTYTAHGERQSSRALTRGQFDTLVRDPQRTRALFVMEACGSSTFWGRTLQERGDHVKLVPPQMVAKLRMGNKTDKNDAEAIFAVHKDERVHPVPLKSVEAQDQLALHATRRFLIKTRVSVSNHLRALLSERGLVAAKGATGLQGLLEEVTDIERSVLSPGSQPLVAVLQATLTGLFTQLEVLAEKVIDAVKANPVAQRLLEAPGIGPITASAVAAEYADVSRFADHRQFAASLGVVPSEHSSGGKQRFGGITKRGNHDIRALLTQCAHTIVTSACPSVRKVSDPVQIAKTGVAKAREKKTTPPKTDDIHVFARNLRARKPRNVVVMAVANRLARMLYVLLKTGAAYRANRPVKTAAAAYT